jgi:TRAP-type C4-dicarboxylate transport system permease small subunit
METRGFLQIEFLINRLSTRQNRLFQVFLTLLALIYSLIVEYKLITYTWSSYSAGIVSISISQTPLFIPQLSMPLGMMVLILELLKEAVQYTDELLIGNWRNQQ